MFSLNDKRATNRGFDDGMSRAFELAATPLVFGAAGYGLDSWLGIKPVLTIALAVFAVVGVFVRMWYGYDAEMRRIEATGAWVKRDRTKDRSDDTETDLWDRRRQNRRPVTGADA